MIAIVMGVSGVGKTTLGAALARRLGWRFVDADDFHPPGNVAKMASGQPLTDEDRWPWLSVLNKTLLEHEGESASAVLACSALKETYRERLTRNLKAWRIVHLHAPMDVIAARLEARKHRYMPASLLASQFATLETPHDAISIDVSGDADACVERIAAALGR